MGIGDWGLGPIPNPQSPIINYINIVKIEINNKTKVVYLLFNNYIIKIK